jgi:hypothetical protein
MITRVRAFFANQQSYFFAIFAISMTPLIQGLLTTTLDGYVTYPQAVIRVLSVVTIFTDFFIVGLALKLGPLRSICNQLAPFVKILIVALILVAVLSIFFNGKPFFSSIFITLRLFLQLLTLFCLVYIISLAKDLDLKVYFSTLVLGVLLYIIYITSIILVIPDYENFKWLSGLPSATSVRHISNYVAIMSTAAMGLFLFCKSDWRILLLIFALVMFLGWTGSRAPFVGLAVALPTAAYLLRSHLSFARVGILAATLGFAVLASAPLPAPDPSFGVMRMIVASDTAQNSDVSSARAQVWQHTVQEIAAAPVIGHGAGRFLGNMDAKYRYDLDNPHNFILQFAYDWGGVGLAIVLLLLATGSATLFRLPVISPLATFCAISGLMLMLSIGMLEGMFYHPLKMLLVSALIAPAFALARQAHVTIKN